MNQRAPVGTIRRPYDSGSGCVEGPEFIRCVDGREPQVHKVWGFGSDDITREVHLTAQVNVGAGVVGELSSNYFTISGRRIPIFGRISIDGSVKYLVVPDFHRTGGPFWDANLLDPHSSWVNGGKITNQNWVNQPGGLYVPSLSVRLTSPGVKKKVCAAAHRIRDNHLQSRRLAPMRIPSTILNPIRNLWFNWRDDYWESRVDQ